MSSLKVVPDGKGMYLIQQEKGGPPPQALSGKYTSYAAGNSAIASFQATVQARVEDNARGKSRV